MRRTPHKGILFLLILFVLSLPVDIFGAEVRGWIYNSETKEPLRLANVYALNANMGTTTNREGYFILDDIEKSRITLRFSFVGYKDKTRTIIFSDSKSVEIVIYLSPMLLPMKHITVTASRAENNLFYTPKMTYSLSEHELQKEKAVRTIPEALNDTPGIMVQKTSHGQGSPYIRGFTGFRNIFLIDGVRLNNSVFREGPNQYWNTVDPLSISELAVIKGTSSVSYGTGAIGGTVNAITARPAEYGNAPVFGARTYYRYSSSGGSHVGRLEIEGRPLRKLGFLLGTSYKNFGDIEGGKSVGVQKNTGYPEWDGDIKIVYDLSKTSEISFLHQIVNQEDVWRTHKTVYGISWEGTSVGDEKERSLDQKRRLTYLQYQGRNIPFLANLLKISASYHTQEEERFRIRKDGRYDVQGFDVNTIGAMINANKYIPIGKLEYGAEYYHDDVDSYLRKYSSEGTLSEIGIQGPVADDATYDLTGIFFQNNIEATNYLSFMLGGRYSYAEVKADKVRDPQDGTLMSVSDQWSSLVGSLETIYNFNGNSDYIIFGSVSQGVRTPNLSDLTRFDTARSNEIETASPGLEPEKFISYEIGIKNRRNRLESNISYFYTDIQNMIVRTPTGNIIEGNYEITKKNGGAGHLQGIELLLKLRFLEHFSSFCSFSWLDGEIETYPTSNAIKAVEPISRLMPATGQAGVKWNMDNIWFEGLITISDKQDRLSTRDKLDTQRIPPGGTPGYTVFSIRSGWKINKFIYLSAIFENITDEDYRIHGSGQNEPGRNFIVTVSSYF